MNLIRDDRGEVRGFAKIVSDETARKQLQDSLTESNAALEQFAWVASHDLQEPLRTISTFSQFLMENYAGKLGEEADQILSFIGNAAGRMRMLVEDLLVYARIATETDRPASVTLDEDLETALTQLSQAVTESNAVVTHDPMPSVRVDRGQMVRLFQNLVGNALKFTAEQGQVTMSTAWIDHEIVISLTDEGCGIAPEELPLLFQRYRRTAAARHGHVRSLSGSAATPFICLTRSPSPATSKTACWPRYAPPSASPPGPDPAAQCHCLTGATPGR